MKILIIGGTGTISSAVSRLTLLNEHTVYTLNRGNRNHNTPSQVQRLTADIADEEAVKKLVSHLEFDVVADFIAYNTDHIQRDFRLFSGKTKQYIFISSASAYQKPLSNFKINESTPLSNPFWEYSRNKILCEELLMKLYRESRFPVTIVRPSHTYSEKSVPLGVHGKNGSFQVIKRMAEGKPVIIHGDGTSLWTMTHADDFARGFFGLMGNIHALGEAVQITSDEILTWNQIYNCIAEALGVQLKPVYVSSDFLAKTSDYNFTGGLLGDKANSVVFDNSKIKGLVPGFEARISFDQGVKNTIAYVLANKECQKEDPEFDYWCDSVIDAQEKAVAAVKEIREKP